MLHGPLYPVFKSAFILFSPLTEIILIILAAMNSMKGTRMSSVSIENIPVTVGHRMEERIMKEERERNRGEKNER